MHHLLLAAILSMTLSAAEPFRADDHWIAIGDSITYGGAYPLNVELFYLTRQPTAALTYTNAGIGGDTAGGVLRRFDWDIAATQPTVATVMLGMNDVGRDNYAEGPDDSIIIQKRQNRIVDYEKNLRAIVARLKTLGSRVILLSPTPYDDTARIEASLNPGCNDALAELGRRARSIAAETDSEFIDLHTRLTTLNRSLQKNDPAFTFLGGDRIHPGATGHFVVAYYFLQAQGVRGTVAIAHLDAKTGGIRKAAHCEVTALTATPQTVSFDYLAAALPFPIPEDAAAALDWIPFQSELNREELRVRGLAAGSYQLQIDEQEIATLAATDLARGINLAELGTPQLAQAREVLEILKKRWELIARLRAIATVEYQLGNDLPRPIAVAVLEAPLAIWEAELAAEANHWQGKLPAEYRVWKPTEAAIRTQADDLLRQARAAAQPVLRRIKLTLVENSDKIQDRTITQ